MSELAKAYDPKLIEEKLYQFWGSKNYFKADARSSKPAFCVIMPPPNVTGVLHMGHALVNTLQDVLVRWKRMNGFEALWVPGTDHAGIATQTVVERQLMAKTGKRRKEFEREVFLEHVWAWKEESQHHILNQLKRLGCSCDWSRLCFTMDEERNIAVKTMFKKLYDAKLIYRGDYLVNWDPATQTALADDEVEYEERESSLWFIRYPLEDKSGHVIVATTRPETMLGDTAVAVSPTDDRYEDLLGKFIVLPLTNRRIPIVADRLIDAAFGTGAVKVTPAHDHIDYQIGLSHNLPLINILTPDGKINENGGEFAGLTVEEARMAVVKKLKDLGLLEKTQPHTHRVGLSYRSKAVIEPYLSKQWFIRMDGFKKPLREAVEKKKVTLIPSNWENTYFHWIDNLRDWCISRQLWWGHRIPIWYRKDNPDAMICYAGNDIPPEVRQNPEAWVQDEDVLDTWFSSALWPMSVLGWPNETEDFKKFYPNSTLITGHDILFFWVARMIMMSEYATNQVPFAQTFLHGLIYGKSYWRIGKDGSAAYLGAEERMRYDLGDKIPTDVHTKWEKMSKSKGNIIDPIEIINSYGTDAMRMALCASATHARQIDLDRRRFEEFKNFANKLWNGARFVFMNIETLDSAALSSPLNPTDLTLEDKWILSLLNRTIAEVNRHLDEYAFDKAATLAYDFFWKEFCAYYVELVKPILFGKKGTPEQKIVKQKILVILVCASLRLMHPMAPFITEELFQVLRHKFPGLQPIAKNDPYTADLIKALSTEACIVAPYPQVLSKSDINPDIEKTFAFMDELVHAIRNIRAEMQLPPSTATDLYIQAKEADVSFIRENLVIIEALVKLNQIHFTEKEQSLPMSASAVVGNVKLIIPLPQEMREKEKTRLTKEKEKLIQLENSLKEKLANQDFVQKAPAQVVDKLKASLDQAEKELAEVMKKIEQL